MLILTPRGRPPSNTGPSRCSSPSQLGPGGCPAGQAWAHPETVPTVTEQTAPHPEAGPGRPPGSTGLEAPSPPSVHSSASGTCGHGRLSPVGQGGDTSPTPRPWATLPAAECEGGRPHSEAHSRHTGLETLIRPHGRHGHHRTHVTLHRAHAPRTRGTQAGWAGQRVTSTSTPSLLTPPHRTQAASRSPHQLGRRSPAPHGRNGKTLTPASWTGLGWGRRALWAVTAHFISRNCLRRDYTQPEFRTQWPHLPRTHRYNTINTKPPQCLPASGGGLGPSDATPGALGGRGAFGWGSCGRASGGEGRPHSRGCPCHSPGGTVQRKHRSAGGYSENGGNMPRSAKSSML